MEEEDLIKAARVVLPTGAGDLMVNTGTEVGGVGAEGVDLIVSEVHVGVAEVIIILKRKQLRRMIKQPKPQKKSDQNFDLKNCI